VTVKFPFSIAVVLLLSACASDPRNANQMAFEEALSFDDRSYARLSEARDAIAVLSEDQIREQLTEALTDVTAIVKQRGLGIYVEYTAPDGRLFMWYPGNSGVVAGTWGISRSYSPPRACFKYLAAHHGVTGEYEPNECVSAEQTLSGAYVIDKRKGDVFELSTRGIPYSKSAGNLPPWPEEWDEFDQK
jgi:hypothetical protein